MCLRVRVSTYCRSREDDNVAGALVQHITTCDHFESAERIQGHESVLSLGCKVWVLMEMNSLLRVKQVDYRSSLGRILKIFIFTYKSCHCWFKQ